MIDIKSNSIILEIEKVQVIGYNFDQVILDDLVSFEGEFSLIESSLSTYGFNYQKWANQQGIYYSVYANDFHCISPSTSLRGLLQKMIGKTEKRINEFLMKTVFSSSDESFGSLNDILVLSGTHISTIFQLFESLLSIFFIHFELISLSFLVGIGSIFHFKFIYRRLILQKILRFIKLDSSDRLGILIILLVLLDVHCVYSNAFIFPILLRTIQCFQGERGFLKRILSLSFVQVLLNHEVNLLQILLFPWIRRIIAIEILLSLSSIFFPSMSNMILSSYELLESFFEGFQSFLEFRGSFQFPIACLLFFYLCSRNKKNQLKSFVIMGSVLLLNINHWYASVNFINVGQGDCILIQLPFNRGNYLIDTGSTSSYSNLRSFLFARGIRELKAVFITHYDEDHAGNIDEIGKDFKLGQIIDEKQENYMDDHFFMTFLLPEYQGNNANSNSLILLCEINRMKFLFLGDISASEEKKLTEVYNDLNVDVVKLAHHGSSTSTSENLLDQIEADYAVISCGLNNRYHHPSIQVIERLKRYPIYVYLTAEEGDIMFILTRFCNFICTSGKFLI